MHRTRSFQRRAAAPTSRPGVSSSAQQHTRTPFGARSRPGPSPLLGRNPAAGSIQQRGHKPRDSRSHIGTATTTSSTTCTTRSVSSTTTTTTSRRSPGTAGEKDMEKEKMRLNGVERTMLPMVLFKMRDARSAKPILGDPYAEALFERCDVDLDAPPYNMLADPRFHEYICNRAKIFDGWCRDFLEAHGTEPVTVLHLACGLDCRHLRVQRPAGANVRWIDLDRAHVTALRSRLMPPAQEEGENDEPTAASSSSSYQLRTLEVGVEGWLRDIPADRPTLILAEGMFPYLEPAAAHRAIGDMVTYFNDDKKSNSNKSTLVLDTMGSLSVLLTNQMPSLRAAGAPIRWGLEEPAEMLVIDRRLALRDRVQWSDCMAEPPPFFGNRLTALLNLLPVFKKNHQFWRFDF